MAEQRQNSPGKANVTALATGASVALVGGMGGRILFTLTQILLARSFGPELFGLYAIGWIILRILSLITPMGLDLGVIRFGTLYLKQDESLFNKVLRQSFTLTAILGVIAGLILLLAAPAIEQAYRKPGLAEVIGIFAIALPFYALLRVASSSTRITQRTQYAVLSEQALQPLLNIILIIAFLGLGWSLIGAATATLISLAIAMVVAFYFVWKLFPQLHTVKSSSQPIIKALITYSFPTALASTFVLSILWIDQLFIGYFLPASSAGIYQAVSQSAALFALLLGSITSIFAPMIATYYGRGEFDSLEELYRVATKWGLYLNLPALLVVAFATKDVLIVVFGDSYAVGWIPFRILLIGQTVNILTGTVVPMLTMTGFQNRWFIISGAMLLLNIVGNLLLIPRFGLAGAAASTTIATSGLFISALAQVHKVFGIWPYDRRHAAVFLSLPLAFVLLLLADRLLAISPLITLVIYNILAYGALAIVLLVKGLDDEDKLILTQIRVRLKQG